MSYRCLNCDYVGSQEALISHIMSSKMTHKMRPVILDSKEKEKCDHTEKELQKEIIDRCLCCGLIVNLMVVKGEKLVVTSTTELPIKETIICSAIKLPDDRIFKGHRHSDCYNTAHNSGVGSLIHEASEGFITSTDRYVTREEAYKLQIEAGKESACKDGYTDGILFSEDLY